MKAVCQPGLEILGDCWDEGITLASKTVDA